MYEFNKEDVLTNWEMQLVWDASFEDGKEEGELEKAKKITKNLLAENLPIDVIVRSTGLTADVVKNLANEVFDDE